eukprot:scaffold2659_cov107-Cylindrotheca_fusiformis.AAC.10
MAVTPSDETTSRSTLPRQVKSIGNRDGREVGRRRPLPKRQSISGSSDAINSLTASLVELKSTLRKKSKQGEALAVQDSTGETIYEWDQSSEHVLAYVFWPFPSMEYDNPETKLKCIITSDTVLIKVRDSQQSKSHRFTTGGLVHVSHSKWSVVCKGSSSKGKKQFAIEVALCKRTIGETWSTALMAKHIGTNHMSTEEIREELQSYGVDVSVLRSKAELLRALRMARSEGSTSFSAMTPNSLSSRHGLTADHQRRSRSNLSMSPPRSEKSIDQKRDRPTRASSLDSNLTVDAEPKKGVPQSRFMENQVVYYTSNDVQKEKARILKIHLDDDLVPFYDIRLENSGKEKQTDDRHLASLTDDLFKAAAAGTMKIPSAAASKQERRGRSGSVGPIKKGRTRSRSADKSNPDLPSRDKLTMRGKRTSRARSEESEKDLPKRSTGKAPERKTPGRSRSMDIYENLYDESDSDTSPTGKVASKRDSSRTLPERKTPGRSRSMNIHEKVCVERDNDSSPTEKVANKRSSCRTLPERKTPGRSRSMDTGGSFFSQPICRYTENEVVYYTSNGQKEKAEILKIHLDDDLVPFYDIRLVEGGKEKQTDDNHLSGLTDDLFKAKSAKDASKDQSSGSSPLPAKTMTELRLYGLHPDSFTYIDNEEPKIAFKFIQADSKKAPSKLKEQLEGFGVDSTTFIEKKEIVGALCRAKLKRRRERTLNGRNSDGSLRNKPPLSRRFSDGPLSKHKGKQQH